MTVNAPQAEQPDPTHKRLSPIPENEKRRLRLLFVQKVGQNKDKRIQPASIENGQKTGFFCPFDRIYTAANA